ncbi:MAG: Rieske (2Fe-2S) protein [Candidatus Zixiibacteriota bacterium]|jgi:menaquinol-cytochrome c reductase iron-sulfur subunit
MNKESDTTKSDVLSESRRKFLSWLGIVLGGIASVIVAVPILSFVLDPYFGKKKQYWRKVGPVAKFKVDTTTLVSYADATSTPWENGFARTAAWLQRRSESEFVAYSINCAHLGCPVRWEADTELFMCPCHGGVYYKDGTVAAGPPPHALTQYPVRIKNGQVEIQTAPVPIT